MDTTEVMSDPAHDGIEIRTSKAQPLLRDRVLVLIAAATTIAVASIYYCQPLLGEMARSVHCSQIQIAHVAMATQVGYALGLALFVPLGDLLERHALVCRLLLTTALASLAVGFAPNYGSLMAASALMGAFAAVVQVIVPTAASLSPTTDRGRAVGIVFSGLLVGVLGARAVGGILGGYIGWRVLYKCAAVALALMAVLLHLQLPRSRAESRLSYPELIKSVMTLPLESATLREVAFYGACVFGGLSGFWSVLVFFLGRPPYHYGAEMAGTLALAGVAAAMAAPLVGRTTDRRGPRFVTGILLFVGVSSYLPLYWWGDRIAGLLAGIILLNFSVNACNVSNQAAMYAAVPHATSRANTFYMVAYFTGGAVGTELSSLAWNIMGWPGVCAVGAALFVAAVALYVSRRSVPLASPAAAS